MLEKVTYPCEIEKSPCAVCTKINRWINYNKLVGIKNTEIMQFRAFKNKGVCLSLIVYM